MRKLPSSSIASVGAILPNVRVSDGGLLRTLSLLVTAFQAAESISATAGNGGDEFRGDGYTVLYILGTGRLPFMLTLVDAISSLPKAGATSKSSSSSSSSSSLACTWAFRSTALAIGEEGRGSLIGRS